jgi:Pvc16 N-terminal domain
MSGFEGIAAVGKSIERMLGLAFTEREPVKNKHTRAVLVQSQDLAPEFAPGKIGQYALSILLYRVDFNKAMRAAWSSVGTADGRGHLPLDLHFLLTPWADNAEHEHLIIGRAMQAIEFSPMLSGPLFYQPELPDGYEDEPRATPAEAVQVLLEEISTEALMRTFDSLPCDYRLTVPYVARVARIDTRETRLQPPVVDAQVRTRVTT